MARFFRLAFLLALSLTVSGRCLAADGPLDVISVQLKWTHQFQFAGYYAAIEKGYYRDVGLEVNLREAKPGDDPVAKVLAGEAEFGVSNSSLILRRAAGDPVVAMAVIFQHSPTVMLYRQHTGVDNVHDLAGKRIMIEPQSEELLAYFKAEGISLDKAFLQKHSFSTDDMIQGKVDAISAYVTSEPYVLKQAGLNFIVLSPRSGGIDFYGDNLFTTESQLRLHPQRSAQFLEATLQGWRYAMAHPDEIAQLIHDKYKPGLSLDQLRYEAHRMAELIHPELIEVGYMNPGRWHHIADTYAELGMLHADYDLDGFLYKREGNWLRHYWPLVVSLLITLIVAAGATYVHFTNRHLRAQLKEIINLEQSLRDDSLRDPLTGLFNRRYLHETLPHEFSRGKREGYPISLAMVDVDYFKNVNDTWGHLAGDEVLKALSKLLNDTLRAGDLASRWGGEEFLLVMPNTPKGVALERAEIWRQRFAGMELVLGEQHIKATLSVGLATFPDDGEEFNDVIQAADLALYLAKDAGRDQVVSFPNCS